MSKLHTGPVIVLGPILGVAGLAVVQVSHLLASMGVAILRQRTSGPAATQAPAL